MQVYYKRKGGYNMASKGQKGNYPVRLTLFVTEEMDDQLDDIASIMNISKNEFIRFQLGNALLGVNKAVQVLKDKADEME